MIILKSSNLELDRAGGGSGGWIEGKGELWNKTSFSLRVLSPHQSDFEITMKAILYVFICLSVFLSHYHTLFLCLYLSLSLFLSLSLYQIVFL